MNPRSEDGGSLGEFALPKTFPRPRTSDLGPRSPDLGLFLHASAVVVEGGAVLFLGHSTAGKSTVVRLLADSFPALADDAVFARPAPEGGWRILEGGFRFEDADMVSWSQAVRKRMTGAEPEFPLRAILRLHKAPELRTAPMDDMERARCLVDAVMEIDIQRRLGRVETVRDDPGAGIRKALDLRRAWFRQVARMARGCPGWRLWFPLDRPGNALAREVGRLVRPGRPPGAASLKTPEKGCLSEDEGRRSI